MAFERWFCSSAKDWAAIGEEIKQMACPHCRGVGTLIRHGFVYGFDESSPQKKPTKRAQRIFCSNRNARPGCGRTFSIWLRDKIRRLSLTAGALWQFLQGALAASIVAAGQAVDSRLTERTWQRIWRRFHHGQSRIRAALFGRCPPPESPPPPAVKPSRQPAAQLLAHLQAAFPDSDCPIADFQHTLQTFFV